jgi:uroporphyrinogen-III synthase
VNDVTTNIGVLVTRPTAQSDELSRLLIEAGANVYPLPVIEIVPRDKEAVRSAVMAMAAPDIVIFISRNSVDCGLPAMVLKDSTIVAAIGDATRAALEGAGIAGVIYPAGTFDSEHLLAHEKLQDVAGKQVLIVRGNSGRELLADTLRARGAVVNHVTAYERITATPDNGQMTELIEAWQNQAIDVVIVMSVDSLTGLLEILPAKHLELLRKTRLVTPSKRVIQTAAELLPGVNTTLAATPQAASLVDAITNTPT